MVSGSQIRTLNSRESLAIRNSLFNGVNITLPSVGSVDTGTVISEIDINLVNKTNEILNAASRLNEQIAYIESVMLTSDQSRIKKDYVYISKDDAGACFCVLTAVPLGEIISIVVHAPGEDLVVQGNINIAGTRLEFMDFTPEEIYGNFCTVLYLV